MLSPFFAYNNGRQSQSAVSELVGAVEEDMGRDGRREVVVAPYMGRGCDRVVGGSEPAVVDSQVVVEEDTEVLQDGGEPCLEVVAEGISRSEKARWWANVVLVRSIRNKAINSMRLLIRHCTNGAVAKQIVAILFLQMKEIARSRSLSQ